eukprot:snap_masked-scaffold_10-processed-gene-4.41-mRNA-1 protein AED:1.00 eAED:1.00 QI:0/0/0/0/1/1/2/0/59
MKTIFSSRSAISKEIFLFFRFKTLLSKFFIVVSRITCYDHHWQYQFREDFRDSVGLWNG